MLIAKKTFGAIVLCATALLCASFVEAKDLKHKVAFKPEQALTEARQATDSLLKDMKANMKAYMKEGGLEKAFIGCSEVAQATARDHSLKRGFEIHRTSLKYRNRKNKPSRHEKRVLKRFDKLQKSGKVMAGHESHSIVKKGKVKYLLYMRPLVTKEFCLNCHGKPEQISPVISKLIKKKYPKGKATGFSAGDIRGAVSVMIPLN